jgi:hypothetical protein
LEKAWENLKRARDTILSWLGIGGKKEGRLPVKQREGEDKGVMYKGAM